MEFNLDYDEPSQDDEFDQYILDKPKPHTK